MTEFKLPDIGEGIVECEVMEWKIAEGDRIEEDQPVVEVMTDKALVEITAPEAGVVTRLHVTKGEMARVHAPLFAYQGDSEAAAGDADEAGGDALNGQQDAACSAETAPSATASNRRRVDFVLPDIGEGIVECEVVEWHVAVGDSICEDQRLVDVMTDKAMVEITAPEDGVVEALYAEKGDMAKVHAPLFGYLADGVEEGPAGPAAQAAPADSAESRPTAEGSSASATIAGAATREQRAHEARGAGRGAFGRVPASPAVRRLVREHQLRLERRVLYVNTRSGQEHPETSHDRNTEGPPCPRTEFPN
ncbi:MAG: biotin/lipoyl-containing protein, partial [Pseudomonadota bacterium]|nr:biotin/lipoyl-containing protein [Pseudomonadota bacterium]